MDAATARDQTLPRVTTPLRRFSEEDRYWNAERECRPWAEREPEIVARIQRQLSYVYETFPLYRRLYDEHGFHPEEVESLRAFATRTPVMTKKLLLADQSTAPPFGTYAGATRADMRRVLASSGTTGKPTLYGISQRDWERGVDIACMGLWSLGVRPSDVVFLAFPFTLFLGGWGMLQGCDALDVCVLPTGTQTPLGAQIEMLKKVSPSVIVGTPSYVRHLGRAVQSAGIDVHPELVLVAGEPGGSLEGVKASINALWGGAMVQDFGAGMTSELYPFFAAVGCAANAGVHIFDDENYVEIMSTDDPYTPVRSGERGAVVVTNLWRESQPMVRFWTGDESRIDTEPCPCGRTYPRLPDGVYGRLDDKLRVHGRSFYASAIDDALRQALIEDEFQIVVERDDVSAIKIEVPDSAGGEVKAAIAETAAQALSEALGLAVPVQLVPIGSLPEQTFKANRILRTDANG